MLRPNDWEETASADNAPATATRAAETDRRHVVTLVTASYETASASGLLQIRKGASVVAEHYIHGSDVIPVFQRGNNGEAVSAVLAASGTGGVLGKVNLHGYSE